MCGILGYIGKSKINNEKFHKIKKIMKNRGPNNFGFTKKTIKKLNINLFHSRLSIIDISAKANQPFIKKNCEIIFNGEIYNHLELKQRLIQMGYKFSTNSDTEVLLTLYIHYGKECVKYLRGMWAFCIWDKKKKFFFLSRDIFGEKPLYYSNQKDGFYFGSETRYIEILSKRKFKVNKNLIKKNLTYGFKSIYKTNETYFEKLYSLNPGENIILNYNLK